jgi:N4-bis(aminopropyl)spermidine synthase
MDADSILAAVASNVGLAEGEAGVRDIIRAIARREPVAVREVSRVVEVPVPIVAAVCNELRDHGVVDRNRPLRLTAQGRLLFDLEPATASTPVSGTCSCCAGRGVVVPDELAGFAAGLEDIAARMPMVRVELDQTHCTVDTKVRRVLAMHEAGALAGRRVLVLGDDDLTSVTAARFAAHTGLRPAIRRMTVVDVDPAILEFVAAETSDTGIAVEVVEYDARKPLPSSLRGAFDVAFTDPPYTVAGAELFLSRALEALDAGVGRHLFFSFGARRPDETLTVQQLFGRLGLTVRSLRPNFNDYVGAGVLAATSHLHHLRTTGRVTPTVTGEYAGPLYTADAKPVSVRPYRCQSCRAVYQVGRGARWTSIGQLKAVGCPRCHGTVFRPLPLAGR